MYALTDSSIDQHAVRQAVANPAFGAIVVFVGVTRDHFEGRKVVELSYEAWPAMAVPEMERIGTAMA